MVKENKNTKKEQKEIDETRKLLSSKKKKLSKIKRRVFKHTWILRIFLVSFVLCVIYLGFLGARSIFTKSGAGFYYKLVRNFVFTPSEEIKSYDSRTNILILGKGGADHEAPDLTDTIIFASIKHPTKSGFREIFNTNKDASVSLISIPRDIWIPELRAKLNSVYYWGNEKRPPGYNVEDSESGGGLVLASSMVEKIVGQPIHYVFVIDFEGYAAVIDEIGGIDVDVENAFVDYKYPVAGKEADECGGDPEFSCRYETVKFEKGLQHMDSSTALKFVRSRHAEGDEGSDFARENRQQKVIFAIKDKIIKDYSRSPQKLLKIWEITSKYLETDITEEEMAILARFGYEAQDSIKSYAFPQALLSQPPLQERFDNLYVFIPRKGDPEDPTGVSWIEVNDWVECVLEDRESCNNSIAPN